MKFSHTLVVAMLALGAVIRPDVSPARVPVVGQTPVEGDHQFIACDSEEQIREIYNARLAHGPSAGVEVYNRLHNTIGIAGGEPACIMGVFQMAIFAQVTPFPMLAEDIALGKQAYLVQLVSAMNGFAFWGLWHHVEPPKTAEPITPSRDLPPKGRVGDFRYILYEPSFSILDWLI